MEIGKGRGKKETVDTDDGQENLEEMERIRRGRNFYWIRRGIEQGNQK